MVWYIVPQNRIYKENILAFSILIGYELIVVQEIWNVVHKPWHYFKYANNLVVENERNHQYKRCFLKKVINSKGEPFCFCHSTQRDEQ